jgi:hypothetical protein
MKLLNKNFKLVKIKGGVIAIPIITPPQYFINDIVLTEYDVRNLQLEVCRGNITHVQANQLEVKDENGLIFNFREDGRLTNTPKGYDTTSRMVLEMFKIDKLK